MTLRAYALIPAAFLLISTADVPPPVQTVTVQAGDSLSTISARYDTPGGPYRLAHVNRDVIDHPDLIEAGQQLVLPTVDGKRWRPRPEPKVSRSWSYSSASSSATSSPASSNEAGGSSNAYVDPSCEAAHSQQWSPSGTYWGKYQFDRQTWAAHGGDPGSYGSASEAEQDAVAARVQYDAWPNC